MRIDLLDIKPVCGACGYQYDKTHPERPVMVFPADDGSVYVACSKCLTALGEARTNEQKNRLINSMKVRDKPKTRK